MGVVTNFDIDVSFWDVNPTFKILGEFANFYRSDTSKGKGASSKVMWAIALLEENDQDNKLRTYSEGDRKKIIAEELIRDDKFKWKKYQYLIDYYVESQMSKSKRSLRRLRKKMEEREDFMETTEYTLSNARELDNMFANTEKLFSLIKKLELEIEKEENQSGGGLVRGGRSESAGERKEI